MSQNNDQGRPDPSQTWYDNGQAPRTKKFPFGAGGPDQEPAPETRNNWQVEAQQDSVNGGNPQFMPPRNQGGPNSQEQTPPYGQSPVNDGPPQAPQYGRPQQGGNYGQPPQQGGNYGQGGQPQFQQGQRSDHPTGEQPPGRHYAQPYQQDQGQPQPGQYGQQNQQPYQQGPYNPQHGQGGHSQGEQPYQQQGQPQQAQPQQGQQPYQQQGQQSSFQGILDPHTGEIHPVPDLDGLQDTDALLVVVSGPDSGSQILLDTDVVTVGRSPNADIFLDDVTVSRKHAEFIRTPSGFTLRDTGSLNGTYVGRQLIDSIELQNGADVQIGKFRMIFQQRPRS